MKILHVVHGYPPNIGGTQAIFQNVSEGLVADYGDEVTVFTTNAYSNAHFWQQDKRVMPTGETLMNGVMVHRFPVFNGFSWLRLNFARVAYKFRLPYHDWARAIYNGPLMPTMISKIAQFEADVVVASAFPLLHMHYALKGGHQSGKPVVFIGGLHPADRWGFDRRMIYNAIKQADGYIAYTAFERDYLVDKGVDAAKSSVMGGAVDFTSFVRADGNGWRKQHGYDDSPIVLFIGQQIAHKGIDTLLKAMPNVWHTLPEARLVIAGRPTAFSTQLQEIITTFSTPQQKRVTILDHLTDEEKVNLIAACDLLALPSRHESFGLVFIEAWACAKPVIGARIGAVTSLIDEGHDGLIVDVGNTDQLGEAILTLLTTPSLRKQMGQAGRKKVLQNYTWDVMVKRFRSVYLNVI